MTQKEGTELLQACKKLLSASLVGTQYDIDMEIVNIKNIVAQLDK